MQTLESALNGDLRTVVELASLAPSVHNTQPWRFTWDGTSLAVYEDRSRSLAVLDPTGRERRISCGAALLTARIAFAELGYRTETTLSPWPAEPDLLGVVRVVGSGLPSREEHELAQAIPRRTTDRDPFDGRPLPDDVREALREAAEQEGSWVRFVADDGSQESIELQVLLSHADDIQRHDPAYLAELAAWRRDGEVVGIASRGLPSLPRELRGSNWAVRDFDAASSRTEHTDHAEPPAAEHAAVLVIGTPGDDPEDWLVAGQALARVLLRAAVDHVAAQPLTQVLELPQLRARMRKALGVLGHPQLLLRVGYGHTAPTSSRRAPEDVVSLVPP